jgi:hypothetical protein
MAENPETQSEVEFKDAKYWQEEISNAKERLEGWYDKAEEAEDRYEDCASRPFGMLNILWSNVETQKAAIGEEFGKPQVTRVNQPENDGGLSRHIANIWERAIAAGVRDTNDNHDIGLAVNDVFVPGRGQVWLELEAEEDAKGNVPWAHAPLVRVPYKDYLEGYATRWGGVPWVARAHMFTRDDLVNQCGMSEEEADLVPLSSQMGRDGSHKRRRKNKSEDQFSRARVWEIWTKYPQKARLYVCEDHEDVLCVDADPYKLKNFFPCPRPLLANGDEGWQSPLTDYSRYEDQAKELDEICARIFVLTATLRRRGVYDQAFKQLADLADAADNVFLPVENWADLQAKGGLIGVVIPEDLQPTITVLASLHEQRRTLIDLIYELSGISDLARGMTDPRETLGAQQLKMSFGAGRFKHRETESRRFAAEAYQIKGEVIAEHFPREQLSEMAGIPLPTQKEIDAAKTQMGQIQQVQQAQQQLQQLQQAMQQPPQEGQPAPQMPQPQQIAQLQAMAQVPLPDEETMREIGEIAKTRFSWERISAVLRSDYRRCYSVEVETDQTNFIDEEADKKARTEFFRSVMDSIQQVAPMIQANPQTGEVFKQMVMFVISSFKAGRSLEEGIERAIDDAIEKAASSQGQQAQDPKAEADAQASQAKLQAAQIGLQREQIKLQQVQAQAGADAQAKMVDQQLAVQEAEAKQREAMAKSVESQNKLATQQQQVELKGIEGQQKIQVQHMANEAKAAGHQIEMQGKAEKLQFERQERATAREEILVDNHHDRQLSAADRHHERQTSTEDKHHQRKQSAEDAHFKRQQSAQDGDQKRREMSKDSAVKRRNKEPA